MAGERAVLRRITDPVVAAAPAGVRIRTRVHLSEAEAAALAGSVRSWDRCTGQNWRPGWNWVGWTTRRTPRGARSANRRSPQCRRRDGLGRSPEL
ncbi:MAG: hypothetical protein QOF25_576 [Mycobacterium sp.]|nr:hypothetical protein [Mycobacterium sp.]